VASHQIGSQVEVRRLPLVGMSYDPKDDVLELLVGELCHLIRAPREFYVDEPPLGIVCLQIIDADGIQDIVTLREPLMLPNLHGTTGDRTMRSGRMSWKSSTGTRRLVPGTLRWRCAMAS
jgi:hypothetical protein